MSDYRKLHHDLFVTNKEKLSPTGLSRLSSELVCHLFRIPILGYFCKASFKLMCFYISHMYKKGDYYRLYKTLISCLSSTHFRSPSRVSKWWYLMRIGVAVAQELQITQFIVNAEIEKKLMNLGETGPEPSKGYDVSYSFVGYGLWEFEHGHIEQSLEYIEKAVEAEPTWGYPHYLLGWFGLIHGEKDIMHHFINAVKIDWSFLHRIKNDRLCQEHPEILKQISHEILIKEANHEHVS